MGVTSRAAQEAYNVGDYPQCATLCREALAKSTSDYQFTFLLASSLRQIGDLVTAKRVLLKGYLNYPKVGKFLTALSEVDYVIGNRKEALEAAVEGAKLHPSDQRLHGQIARCYALVGDIPSALEAQDKFETYADENNRNLLRDEINMYQNWFTQPDCSSYELPNLKSPGLLMQARVPDDKLSTLTSLNSDREYSPGTIIGLGKSQLNSSVRNVSVCVLSPSRHQRVYGLLYQELRRIRPDAVGRIVPEGPLQFVKYDAQVGGHYHWHQDTGVGRYLYRELTMAVGVSRRESYDGGELQVNVNGDVKSLKLGTGDVAVFGSVLKHRVTPVEAGVRTVVIGWFRAVH